MKRLVVDQRERHYMLVDVQEQNERAAYHIAGDVWVPLADMRRDGRQWLRDHYLDRSLVLYCECRGPRRRRRRRS